MKLTETQVQEIKHCFRAKGFKNQVSDEILDHCCTEIENQLKGGITFSEATRIVLNQAYIDSLKKMNKKLKIIHFTKNIYMKIIIVGLLLTSVISFDNLFEKKDMNSSFSENTAAEVPLIMVDQFFNDPPEIWPLSHPGKVSSGYGMRMHPIEKEKRFHFGIDIPAAKGTPVLATSDGEIIEAGYTKNYGNYIIIKHDNIYSSRYSQLFEIQVKKGDKISKGDQIGTVGSSGRSTAPHLHFEITESGKHVDPMKYIKA